MDRHRFCPDQTGSLYDTQQAHCRGGNWGSAYGPPGWNEKGASLRRLCTGSPYRNHIARGGICHGYLWFFLEQGFPYGTHPAVRLYRNHAVFFGLRSSLGLLADRTGRREKLHAFTFRQLQENVIHRSHSLAISSLLILAALCCFGAGVAIAQFYKDSEQHVLDYTFPCAEEKLSAAGFSDEFDSLFDMKVGHINPAEDYAAAFSMSSVLKELESLPDSQDKAILLNNFSYDHAPYLIALSGYNRLLAVSGLPEITLSNDEAAVYMDTGFTDFNKLAILNEILSGRPEVRIADKAFHLTGSIHTVNLVVDRSITLSFALIVPDEVFERMTDGDYTVYLDAVLSQESLKGQSLLEAVSETNDRLTRAGIPYESSCRT